MNQMARAGHTKRGGERRMKTVKGMLIGMGVAASAALLLWKSPMCREAMENTMQDAIDKAEDLKNSLGK